MHSFIEVFDVRAVGVCQWGRSSGPSCRPVGLSHDLPRLHFPSPTRGGQNPRTCSLVLGVDGHAAGELHALDFLTSRR